MLLVTVYNSRLDAGKRLRICISVGTYPAAKRDACHSKRTLCLAHVA